MPGYGNASKMQIRSSLEIEDFMEFRELAEAESLTVPAYLRKLCIDHLNLKRGKETPDGNKKIKGQKRGK